MLANTSWSAIAEYELLAFAKQPTSQANGLVSLFPSCRSVLLSYPTVVTAIYVWTTMPYFYCPRFLGHQNIVG